MNCLKNYIGIKNCNSPDPISGLYVNQLPGITLKSIDRSADDTHNFVGVWEDVQARAWLRLQKDIRVRLKDKYKLKTVKSNISFSPEVDTSSIIPASGTYRGIVIDLNSESPFFAIGVSRLRITMSESHGIQFKIFDKEGEVDTIRHNASPGKNIINVDKKYLTSFLFIGVDSTSVPVYNSFMQNTTGKSCCRCVDKHFDCDHTVHGAQALKEAPLDIDETDSFYGISVDYSVMCDYSSLVCSNKTEFTDVWLYLLGAEIAFEAAYSTRINRYTTIDRDTAVELMDTYTEKYEESLKLTVSGLSINSNDCCLECNSQIMTIERLP